MIGLGAKDAVAEVGCNNALLKELGLTAFDPNNPPRELHGFHIDIDWLLRSIWVLKDENLLP